MFLVFFLFLVTAPLSERWGVYSLYTTETPVKLLDVDLFGKRFLAASSDYMANVTGGRDQFIDRTNKEEANKYPEMELILSPGGIATYHLPATEKLIYLMIKPGKKSVDHGSPFKDKANITVSAFVATGESVSESCYKPSSDHTSIASDYCILSVEALVSTSPGMLTITIQVPIQETREAAIWEIYLSPLDDSKRVEGTFNNEARQKLRETQETEEFNTILTMISVVGKTGVGKSTVASLLAGNSTMFTAKSSSSGTTTLGADISTIIPSSVYSSVMEPLLETGPLYHPNRSRPLFLIDSEGMAFRGDEVDFVTTGPVAIIANMIVWITSDRLRPSDILEDIRDYLKGLDRISMTDDSSSNTDYGEFVVVLNKMQDTTQSDEELCEELLEYGSSDEDDETIDDLYYRFQDIFCIGLPMITLDEGEIFDYPALTPRFKEGLAKISNKFLMESETPRNVRVGDQTFQMNSTEAETIIGMVIAGANQGNIDLTDPCNVLFSINQEKVIQFLSKLDEEIADTTTGKCINSTCSACVCEYKTAAAEITRDDLVTTIMNAISLADSLCDSSVGEQIEELIDDLITPWYTATICSGIWEETENTDGICDISEMTTSLNQPGQEVKINCTTLFLCESSMLNAKEIQITTNSIFVAKNSEIETANIEKAPRGENGKNPGDNGENGADGEPAGNMIINAASRLMASQDMIIFTSRGGDGGDGGDGADGLDRNGDIPDAPNDPKGVYEKNHTAYYHHKTTHTSCLHCHGYHEYWYYQYFLNCDACGGNGGRGGDGGDGGSAGVLTVQGPAGVTVRSNRLESVGGLGGLGGNRALGSLVKRTYKSKHHKYSKADCDWMAACEHDHGDVWYDMEWPGDGSDTECNGSKGAHGTKGASWKP